MFCHTERLRDHPARLKLVLSDSAKKWPETGHLNKWQIKVADLVDTFVEETLELISLELEQPIAIGLAYRLAQHHIFVQGLQGFVQTRWNVAPLPHIFQPI